MIQSINPASEEPLATFDAHTNDEVERALSDATAGFRDWRAASIAARASVLIAAADELDRERDTHAQLLTREMGKTIRAAREEVAKCARTLRFYADNAPAFMRDKTEFDDGRVAYEPLGAVLAIMPWNFPYWQVIRFAAPALAAGNVALLKHASNVPQCALQLERLFARAGAPRGVFQTLLIETSAVEAIIADERVAAVTLTGSEAAGRAVGGAAGRHLKKCVLELGGSDPFVVLAGADVREAAGVAASARTVNNGQSCIAAKRFIVEHAAHEEFTSAFVGAMRALRLGDPMDESTDVGPLAMQRLRDELHSQVQRTVAMGARVLCGGEPREGRGFFYPPTVLAVVPADSPAAREELFGPVAPIFVAEDAGHALQLANDNRYGLGASVWTRDAAVAERFARELESGTVAVNGMVASDPRFPFGGVKNSGYGRELGIEGMHEFVNIKTIRSTAVITHAE